MVVPKFRLFDKNKGNIIDSSNIRRLYYLKDARRFSKCS